MDHDDRDRLRAAILAADSSPVEMRALFAETVDRLGSAEASALWWAVFGAQDASET